MSIVRQPCRKGRPIIESVRLAPLGQLDLQSVNMFLHPKCPFLFAHLSFECLDLFPAL